MLKNLRRKIAALVLVSLLVWFAIPSAVAQNPVFLDGSNQYLTAMRNVPGGGSLIRTFIFRSKYPMEQLLIQVMSNVGETVTGSSLCTADPQSTNTSEPSWTPAEVQGFGNSIPQTGTSISQPTSGTFPNYFSTPLLSCASWQVQITFTSNLVSTIHSIYIVQVPTTAPTQFNRNSQNSLNSIDVSISPSAGLQGNFPGTQVTNTTSGQLIVGTNYASFPGGPPNTNVGPTTNTSALAVIPYFFGGSGNQATQVAADQRGSIGGFPADLVVSNIQGPTTSNSESVSAANSAVSKTLSPSSPQRAFVYSVHARCSAGTSNITLTDGGTTTFTTAAGAVGTTDFTYTWHVPYTGGAGATVVVTLAACGAANTGTLDVQASTF